MSAKRFLFCLFVMLVSQQFPMESAKHKEKKNKNFEFAATGDFDYVNPLAPGYLKSWQHRQVVHIIRDINRSPAKFTLGVGDSGNSSPKNQEYIDIKKR